MDWDDFRKTLETKLAMVQTVEEFMTEADLLEQITKLDAAIKETIKEQVPINKPSLYAKRWWTKNLTEMKKYKERLARLSYRKRVEDEDPVHEEFRQAWNSYSEVIRRMKEEHWLESLDEQGIWTANRLVSGPAMDGGRCRIPTLLVKEPITN